MTDNIDALGGLVDAGLIARSLDGAGNINAAEIADAHHQCANCDRSLAGNFCSHCGQKAHLHRSLLHVGEEFLHGITHFDGKAWQTLPMLLFRPGKLTRDYIMGKRSRYIAPVPLFLLVVFLMFFVFSFVHIKSGGGATGDDGKQLTQTEAQQQLPKIDAELAKIDREIAAASKNPKPGQLAGLNGQRIGVKAGRDAVQRRANGELVNTLDLPGEIAREVEEGAKSGKLKVNLGNATLTQKAQEALRNPQLALYKVQGKIYKFSFLLVPMSLPWLWLMFAFRRDVRMYDHAVFALYSISFMSLVFIAISIGLTFDFVDQMAFMLLVPPLHMFAQLKGAYRIGWLSAAWRTVALTIAAGLTLCLYLAIALGMGLIE